jgi:predicted metal-dependent hydrolase
MRSLLQFTLDLFGSAPARQRAKVTRPGAGRLPRKPAASPGQSKPLLQRESSELFDSIASVIAQEFAINNAVYDEVIGAIDGATPARAESALPAMPFGAVMPPTRFHHPRATREVLLGDARVAYEFKRGKRRTIGFMVGPEGLVVSAPKWVPLGEVDAALKEKAGWIVKKLRETHERQAQLASHHIEWRDGVSFPFLGTPVQLVLDPGHSFASVGAQLVADVEPLQLRVALPHSATPAQIRDAVQAWLMRQARRNFTLRLDHFAPLLQVRWQKLSLSSAGTRWGSANSSGSIRLNWRLIHFKQNVIDYVVAHELSHLRVMDHSPRFWDTVREVVPDYAELRGQLKDESIPRWK